jgi:DNA repair photolyase
MPHAVLNPPNPFDKTRVSYVDDHIDVEPPLAKLEIFEEEAKSILAENQSPDVGFRFSANPYRGCFHGCAYCYARPSHQYLGFGAGTDFERKIVVKKNAVALLREHFEKKSWEGDVIALSGNTDCYQPLEASYRLTRGMLEVCAEYRNPVGLITKSSVIRRDIDLLARLSEVAHARVTLSAAFADDETGRALEPWASPISRRFETMKMLSDAGVTVGLSLAPIIPGINDSSIPELLERGKAAGASYAFIVLLRLSGEVLPVFEERLERAFPLRAEKVRNAIRDMRDGAMNVTAFGKRMRGTGARWDSIEQVFRLHVRKLGLNLSEGLEDQPTTFVRPGKPKKQLTLF